MRISRTRQRQILETLAEIYPRHTNDVVRAESDEEDLANLWYLRDHGLVDASIEFSLSGAYIFQGANITAKGMDFLADDGGLSAILGTLTVRLHADTIREILLAKVEQSTLPLAEKSRLRKHLGTMSNEALKTVTNALVEQGLQKVPDLVKLIQGLVQGAA